MKIDKKELQNALEIVKPGLAYVELMEQTNSFAFLGDRVVTYNDSISLSHPITGLALKGAVRADELYGFLQKTKHDDVQIICKENEIKLKCGPSMAGLLLQSEIKLPIFETGRLGEDYELYDEFIDDLSFIRGSCSKDMSRRVLTCVHVLDWGMEASDGFQIMRVYNNLDTTDFNNSHFWSSKDSNNGILIPAEVIPEIKNINPITVSKTDGWLHFMNAENTRLSCRILTDIYPSTENYFEVDGEEVTFPEQMTEILERVEVFTKGDHILNEEMEIHLKGGVLMVIGKNEYGWFKEKAKVGYEGEPVSFWISPYLLKNILNRGGSCVLSTNRIKFHGDGWEYVAVLRAKSV